VVQSVFPDAAVLQKGKRGGPAYAKNEGAQKATGRWLLFLDNDTVLEKTCVSELLKYSWIIATRIVSSVFLVIHYTCR